MSTTTRPTPVLSRAQYDELWTLFCQYGRLREQQGAIFASLNVGKEEYVAQAKEADAAQERFGTVLASLTVYGADS